MKINLCDIKNKDHILSSEALGDHAEDAKQKIYANVRLAYGELEEMALAAMAAGISADRFIVKYPEVKFKYYKIYVEFGLYFSPELMRENEVNAMRMLSDKKHLRSSLLGGVLETVPEIKSNNRLHNFSHIGEKGRI